ncbi:MAG TPA: FMN-binding protein [Jatrophihabitantaceae bacterium]
MKRVILSVVGTVAGLVALLSFKAQGHPLPTAGPLPSAGLPAPSPTPAPSNSAGSGATSGPGSQSAAKGSGGTSAASAARTVMGNAVETQYGIVQVQVTVTGTHIDNVSFVQLQAFDGRSQQINSQAAPILLQETVAAQSAHIDSVSGATFTSDGYVQSLQSALDQVGIR